MTKILFDKMFDKSESDIPKSSEMDRTVGINKHQCENTSVSGPSSIANQSKKRKKKSNIRSDDDKPKGMFANLEFP